MLLALVVVVSASAARGGAELSVSLPLGPYYRPGKYVPVRVAASLPEAGEYTLTVAGETFTATTPQGSYAFHVARVGDDRILLRASPSGPTTRRFTVGMPEKGSFAPGTFVGGTSEGDWGELTFDAKSISLTATASTGAATAMTGTVYPAAYIQQLAAVQTADSGNFFISRSTDLGVLFAARGNALRPGFVTIGVRQ